MTLYYLECEHCGDEYPYQGSGSYDSDQVAHIPREHRDSKHCPECKKAIYDALQKIPVKFKYQSVNTDEVDIDTLLRWEEERNEENRKSGGLFAMRVLAGTFNTITGESEKVREVIGREDKKGRIYIYGYYPSKKSTARIMVERRVNQLTKEVGKYKIKN